MRDFRDFFKGKRITVLGLGLLGRGVGDAEFLAACGAHVTVTDKKDEKELAEPVSRLKKKYPDIAFHLGGHKLSDFTDCDMVLKAAGVPLGSPEIAAARKASVPVYMSTALFAKFAGELGATIVGVTGTRGKSTMAHMIHHALIQAGRRTHLGGNVRGRSTLAMLPDIKKGDVCVLELDSWQLQGFGDLKISPHIAVFTNLMPDHLNYYGAAQASDAEARRVSASEPSKPHERSEYRGMDTYFADKANIFRFQKKGDVLIVGRSIADRIRAAVPYMELPQPLPADWKLRVVGTHNEENAALAASALKALGLTESEIKEGVESFEGVEGRLQFVREVRGVKIYNDNNATTPEATIAALRALGADTNIALIMGGADKELDMNALLEEIRKTCKAVFLLAGTGTERIRQNMQGIPVFDSLKSALEAALDSTVPGNILLFSPAFASFGMFKNEYDRNDQFMRIVKSL